MHATKVVSILPPRLNQLAWSFDFVYDTVGGEGSKHGELGWRWRKQIQASAHARPSFAPVMENS